MEEIWIRVIKIIRKWCDRTSGIGLVNGSRMFDSFIEDLHASRVTSNGKEF